MRSYRPIRCTFTRFLGVPDGLDTNWNHFEIAGNIFEQFAVFDPYLGHFAHKTGPNGQARGGGPERDFGVFEAAKHSGGPLKVIWSKKNFF